MRQRNSNPAIAAFQNAACQIPLEDLIIRPFLSLCLDQKMNGGQAQMAQGVSNAALNGISDGAAADIVSGQLSKNNPANVQKGVTDSLNKLTKILEENRLVGAMISIKYRCRKCICDKDGVWGWDWPDEQRSPFVIDDNHTDGEVVYHLKDSSGGGERLEVSKVQPWHITEAIELARKSCEGE